MAVNPRFKIGQTYMTRGKSPVRCTVVDIHTTTNARGEIVKLRYVSEHHFLGQIINDYEVVDATIARGLAYEELAEIVRKEGN